MWSDFIDFLSRNMLTCPSKLLSGQDCPGCGIQRSFVLLLQGELVESFLMFPALIPMLTMLGYLLVHLKFHFRRGHKVLLGLFFLTLSIMLTNYFIKLL